MRKLLTILLTLLPLALFAETAEETVRRFINRFDAQELYSDFTLTVTESAAQPMNYPGTIRMMGKQFALTMFGMEAAYDGTTLYMYAPENDELTLSTPSEEELLEANPVLFCQALLLTSKVRYAAKAPQSGYAIEFLPNNTSAGIHKFVLTLTQDLLPCEIILREGKKDTRVVFTAPRYQKQSGKYEIQQAHAFLNDLR